MNLIIEIVIIFILLILYFSSKGTMEKADWGRALVLAIALPIFSLIPNYLGMLGWLIAVILSLIIISKATGQSIIGSVLFLIVLGIILYFVELGIHKLII